MAQNIVISNDTYVVTIKKKGAELSSIINKNNNIEYIWQAGEQWTKHSPVLFPIVGTLKNNTYLYNDKSYSLSRHGFARHMDFDIYAQYNNKVVFQLQSNYDTLKLYPFKFNLYITYVLDSDKLSVIYKVENRGEGEMYFSIGGHPAFNVPLTADTMYDDYWLQFEKYETIDKWPISANGLIEETSIPFLNSNQLPLQKSLFAKDALVFKHLQSNEIILCSAKHSHGIRFTFSGFTHFGIWAAKDANFVCLEPWCGIADSVLHNQHIEDKEGIIRLTQNKVWEKTWSVACY